MGTRPRATSTARSPPSALHAAGEQALRNGHRITARETFLRASNHYRTADFYLREDPAHDPEVAAPNLFRPDHTNTRGRRSSTLGATGERISHYRGLGR